MPEEEVSITVTKESPEKERGQKIHGLKSEARFRLRKRTKCFARFTRAGGARSGAAKLDSAVGRFALPSAKESDIIVAACRSDGLPSGPVLRRPTMPKANRRSEIAKEAGTSWRETAMDWIRKSAALPKQPSDRWQVAQPTQRAQENTIEVIKILGADAPAPSGLVITPDNGIEIEWRHADRLVSIEILADGTIESLKCVRGAPILEEKRSEPDWRLHDLVTWVQGTV